MSERIAIVTGGIGGIGTTICEHLADNGCRVIAADLGGEEARIEEWRRSLNGSSERVEFRPLDVSSFESCGDLIDAVEKDFGSVDILVNGAGITRDSTLKKMPQEDWQTVININLSGVFNLCRHAVEGMTSRGFGRIVNISSVNGQTGQFGQTNYSASKAGMHGFTMALAREVARKGVTVNSISPGYCDTRLMRTIPEKVLNGIVDGIPVGRLGDPAEIARVVAFLSDEHSGYITGANIPVNGGYYMS